MTELLERQLIVLSERIDVDVGDRLVDDVMRRIDLRGTAADGPAVQRSVARRFAQLAGRRRLAVAGLVLAAALVAVLAIPGSRHAVADWFGIGSTRIERTPDTGTLVTTATSGTTPRTTQGTTGTAVTDATAGAASLPATTHEPTTTVRPTFPASLDLGQSISAAEARELTGLPVPVSDLLGAPSGVYVVTPPNAGQVIVAYPASATLPKSPVAGVGALLSAVSGRLNDSLLVKVAEAGTTVETLSITVASGASVPAVWLEGDPHSYAVEDNEGSVLFGTLRLATNTLLWMEDGVVFRLEAELARRQAIDIAATVVAAK